MGRMTHLDESRMGDKVIELKPAADRG
jgi:hypothetical protein